MAVTNSSDPNSLSYLIPTGENDIAVREILIKIFGDAVSCKVPGASCGTQQAGDPGALAASIISVFNGGTLVFVTILLIFIGLVGFVKTAQDGEFFGRSWNTTFTAMRLVAGIAFILPMPNSYSTIQNFVLYVGLWSSGLANEGNKAVAEHYLHRLQKSMVNSEPEANSVRNEAQEILRMHMCASLINKLYPTQADLQFYKTGLGNKNRVEFTYLEKGSYLTPDSAPCGRLVVLPVPAIALQSAVPTNGVWNGTMLSDPLTSKARESMQKASQLLAQQTRDTKINILTGLSSPNSAMRNLADKMVDRYAAGNIVYDPATGSVASAPTAGQSTGRFTETESIGFLNTFASIVRSANSSLNSDLEKQRKDMMDSARDGDGAFFAEAKAMLENGGWMATASTYRTMLDMVSIQFVGDKQSPFKLEGRDEFQNYGSSSSNGMASQLASLDTLTSRMFEADTAKEVLAQGIGDPSTGNVSPPAPSQASIEKLATSKLSFNDAMETVYGTGNTVNAWRNGIMKGMTVSADYDPLYQMKAIGDLTTATAEGFVVAETLFRGLIATTNVGVALAKGNIGGKIVNGVFGVGDAAQAAVSGIQYLTEQIFTIMRVLTTGLVALGYVFSTWLPALPFVAFLLAQLGWLFGLIMTLFAMNIWGVMHVTPARNDSFIGSEAQGYLLLVALFFRPIIAVSALSLSYIIAPPVVKLVNITLLPMMYASNVSTNTISLITATMFGLVLYFGIIKAVLVAVYMIPQSFPDEVMRIISAGIGDLGQSRALSTMETSEGSARVGMQTLSGIDQAGSASFKGMMKNRNDAAAKSAEEAEIKSKLAAGANKASDMNQGPRSSQ